MRLDPKHLGIKERTPLGKMTLKIGFHARQHEIRRRHAERKREEIAEALQKG